MAKKRTSKDKDTVSVESIRHRDKRKNIPTEELRDFVAEDKNAPKTMLYPRDPSLDPQLAWKGETAKIDSARTFWGRAISNHTGLGRWDYVGIANPWDAMNTIRARLQKGTEL
jgi:hypothetical protein